MVAACTHEEGWRSGGWCFYLVITMFSLRGYVCMFPMWLRLYFVCVFVLCTCTLYFFTANSTLALISCTAVCCGPDALLNLAKGSEHRFTSPHISTLPSPYISTLPSPHMSTLPSPQISTLPLPHISTLPSPHISTLPSTYCVAAHTSSFWSTCVWAAGRLATGARLETGQLVLDLLSVALLRS